jgi:hypothetical protein
VTVPQQAVRAAQEVSATKHALMQLAWLLRGNISYET